MRTPSLIDCQTDSQFGTTIHNVTKMASTPTYPKQWGATSTHLNKSESIREEVAIAQLSGTCHL